MRRLAAVCLAVYSVALVMATHWPSSQLPKDLPPDKWLHFWAYAILTYLLVFATTDRLRDPSFAGRCRYGLTILAIVAVFGFLDEVTQPLTGRGFEWLDWAADVGGAVFALVTVAGFAWLRDKMSP